MDRSMLPRELRPFVDDCARLSQWPSRYKVQRMAVALIAREWGTAADASVNPPGAHAPDPAPDRPA